MSYDALFSPIKLRGLELKNRVVLPGMNTKMVKDKNDVGEDLPAYHAARAAGGCGLNIVELVSICPECHAYLYLGLYNEHHRDQLRKITDAIHVAGGKAAVPLLGWADLAFRIPDATIDPRKLYVAMTGTGTPPRYCRSEAKNGWVYGKVRELGMTYYLASDQQAPTIKATSRSYDHVTLSITDSGSGTAGWEATIDGQFVLFEQQKNPTILVCDLRRTPVGRLQKERQLRVTAWDFCGNRQTFETSINY